MIFVIEDDGDWRECILKYLKNYDVRVFGNGLEAVEALKDGLPDIVFLDILLDGPDGFTVLNELQSYEDTAKIPVVVVSGTNLDDKDLSEYGVVRILNKNIMTPEDVTGIVRWIYEQKQ
jgi:CheY-like chemotaxis protein